VQAREVKNGSRFGGRVKKILVQEGQQVQEGQLLIEFDDTDLQAKIADAKATLAQALAQEHLLAKGADIGLVRQASSAVQQAQERLKMVTSGARPEELAQAQAKVRAAEDQSRQAQQAFENAKVMLDEGIISKQKYDSLRDAANAAQASLDAAKANLKMMQAGGRPEERRIADAQLSAAKAQYAQLLRGARPEEASIASANVEKAKSALQALEAQLEEVQIRAPFAGHVSVIGVTEGELVAPGRPVVTILNYDNLWVDVYVPESKLSMVTLGDTVKVRAKSLQKTEFLGKVALINPKSEFVPNSGGNTNTEEQTFRVKVSLNPKDTTRRVSLYPGMKVEVLFQK
ncbi:MAG TPA: efflux RND transporter periplasmic adaptor subunit, partial [Oculatellaceae cyanobacterium]